MDCRIGTPNEHLAGNDDELKNPLYATGVGLVMKGIEKYERDSKRGVNSVKVEVEVANERVEKKKKEQKDRRPLKEKNWKLFYRSYWQNKRLDE